MPRIYHQSLDEFMGEREVVLAANDDGFRALAFADRNPPTACLATEWASSATQAGELYLFSEANGARNDHLAQLRYGRVAKRGDFAAAWHGQIRQGLSDEFARGLRRAPPLHKLSGLDRGLVELRERYGVISQDDAEIVATGLRQLDRPKHWMFI